MLASTVHNESQSPPPTQVPGALPATAPELSLLSFVVPPPCRPWQKPVKPMAVDPRDPFLTLPTLSASPSNRSPGASLGFL